jgi:hypothetical protein
MGKRKPRPRIPPSSDKLDTTNRREKVLKVRLTQAELRRVRIAAILIDVSNAQFLRMAVLEKAEAVARDPKYMKRLQDDCLVPRSNPQ